MREIRQILLESGWKYKEDGDIEPFQVNGEMAPVTWYRQRNKEYNGKYVIEIHYEDEKEKCPCLYEGEEKCCHQDCKICRPVAPTK